MQDRYMYPGIRRYDTILRIYKIVSYRGTGGPTARVEQSKSSSNSTCVQLYRQGPSVPLVCMFYSAGRPAVFAVVFAVRLIPRNFRNFRGIISEI